MTIARVTTAAGDTVECDTSGNWSGDAALVAVMQEQNFRKGYHVAFGFFEPWMQGKIKDYGESIGATVELSTLPEPEYDPEKIY